MATACADIAQTASRASLNRASLNRACRQEAVRFYANDRKARTWG